MMFNLEVLLATHSGESVMIAEQNRIEEERAVRAAMQISKWSRHKTYIHIAQELNGVSSGNQSALQNATSAMEQESGGFGSRRCGESGGWSRVHDPLHALRWE